MTNPRLQEHLDQLLATTRQRWLLAGSAVLSVVLASAAMALSSDHTDEWVVFVVFVLAVGTTVEPDDHLALVVMAVVVVHWLTLGLDVVSPGALAVAVVLLLFHVLIALMAVTPHAAVVHPEILRRWLGRGVTVVGVTLGVWLLIVTLEGRNRPGSVVASAAAFVVLSVAIVALRVQTVPTRRRGGPT